MQKALKDDEELVVWFQSGAERLRVMEVFAPSRQMVVLSGHDAERNLTRVVCAVESLQLVCKVIRHPSRSPSPDAVLGSRPWCGPRSRRNPTREDRDRFVLRRRIPPAGRFRVLA